MELHYVENKHNSVAILRCRTTKLGTFTLHLKCCSNGGSGSNTSNSSTSCSSSSAAL
jgi:hypothetical protein